MIAGIVGLKRAVRCAVDSTMHFRTWRRSDLLTVIAALSCGDYYVVCSDSKATDLILSFLTVKLEYITDPPVCWATSGDSAIGQEFDLCVRNIDWGMATWDEVKNITESEIARLNGKWRRLQRAAGKKPDPYDVANALIVGFVQGEGRILKLTDRGPGEFITGSFAAVGSGEPHAFISYQVLRKLVTPPMPHERKTIEAIIELTAQTNSQQCGGPIQTLRVSRGGLDVADIQALERLRETFGQA